MNIIGHIGLSVADYDRAVRLYESVLAPLGINVEAVCRKPA